MHNTPVKSVRRKDFDIAEIFSRLAANKQAQSMREGGSVFFEVSAV